MTHYLLAYVVFLAAHVVPSVPAIRRRLTALAGERAYLVVYALVSTVLLVWLVAAALTAPYVELWPQTEWARALARYLAPIGLVLIVVGLIAPNPLSVTMAGATTPGAITAVIRHPVLWGFAIWAGAHIPVNGDVAFVSLFAGFLAFAFLGMLIVDRKKQRRFGMARWREMARESPLLALPGSPAWARFRLDRPLLLGLLLGGALAAAFLFGGHVLLFGVDPLL